MNDMKIVHVNLEVPLTLSAEYPKILIVENPSLFYSFVSELNGQMNGEKGDFVLYADGEMVDLEKYGTMISDFIHFDLNDKKILSTLYKKAELFSNEGLLKINAEICNFMSEFILNFPFDLTFENLNISNLLKGVSLHIVDEYDSILEKIVCYINILAELKFCKFFVFVNLKSILNDEQIIALYNHCALEQISLLLIESSKIRELLPMEKATIITDDLCEILENI